MAVPYDQLCIIAVAIKVYQVIKAQRGQLPDQFFPLGCQQSTSYSTVEFFDGYVQVGQSATQLTQLQWWLSPGTVFLLPEASFVPLQKRVVYSEAWP